MAERKQKDPKSGGLKCLQGNSVLQTQQNTYELLATVTAHTRPGKAQTSQILHGEEK